MTVSAYFNLFRADWYLTRNPDIAEAVRQGLITAEEHFHQFGNSEGRAPGPMFNPHDYLAANPDVANAVREGLFSAYGHFVQFGTGEGRPPLSLFDPDFYLAQNSDVAAAVRQGLISATEHFLLYGHIEPRQINPFVHLGAYLKANPDIAAAVANGASAFEHLLQYGMAEARSLGNGIDLSIFANDPAFQRALASGDYQQALERVQEVAPFLPDFQPAPGWLPPADTPIPIDFIPPAGMKLVIPPSVVIPPGMTLPPTFEPITPPAPPDDGDAPPDDDDTPPDDGDTPPDDGGPSPKTFIVSQDPETMVVTFSGTATGDITLTTDGEILTFTRDGLADTLGDILDAVPDGKITDNGLAGLDLTHSLFNELLEGFTEDEIAAVNHALSDSKNTIIREAGNINLSDFTKPFWIEAAHQSGGGSTFIHGSDGGNHIYGADNHLVAGDHSNILHGGEGNDAIYGGSNSYGGNNHNALYGYAGDDFIVSGIGTSTGGSIHVNDIHPGTGVNTIHLSYSPGINTIFFVTPESEEVYNNISAFTAGAAPNSVDILHFNALIPNLDALGWDDDSNTFAYLTSSSGPDLNISDHLFSLE